MATPPDFVAGQILTAAQMNGIGLWEVKSQVIGTTVSSVTVTGAFSADYDNYLIMISDGVGSASTSTAMTLGSTTAGYYYGAQWCTYGGVTGVYNGSNVAAWSDIIFQSTNAINCQVILKNPFLAKRTFINYQTSGAATASVNLKVEGGGYLDNNTSYTAFTLTPASGTLTGGTIRVYGYRN